MTFAHDPWSAVRVLLTAHPEPTKEQAMGILLSLAEIDSRIKRVKQFSPNVKVGWRLVRLLQLVGLDKSHEWKQS